MSSYFKPFAAVLCLSVFSSAHAAITVNNQCKHKTGLVIAFDALTIQGNGYNAACNGKAITHPLSKGLNTIDIQNDKKGCKFNVFPDANASKVAVGVNCNPVKDGSHVIIKDNFGPLNDQSGKPVINAIAPCKCVK